MRFWTIGVQFCKSLNYWNARVKTSNTTNLKKPSGTPGGCLRLPVYGRLSLVIIIIRTITLIHTRESGLRRRQRVTVHDVRHLATARSIDRDDAEVVDGATGQVVVHQTDGTVSMRRTTTTPSFTGGLEVNHVLCARHISHHHHIAA